MMAIAKAKAKTKVKAKPKVNTRPLRRSPRKPPVDERREHRITTEAIVDCYNSEEAAMGWYYYIESKVRFPFTATCLAERAVSPLEKKSEVEVVGMAPEEECGSEVFVCIRWGRRPLAVPLAQLQPISGTDKKTLEAVADWHYWVGRGYVY
jgi:hypothetical protein